MTRYLLALLLGAAIVVPAPVAAATTPVEPRKVQIAEDVDLGEIVLSELEKRLIRSYYSRHLHDWVYEGGGRNKGIPPGLAKKGWLPPGIYKQLVAGQRVPGDVRLYPLPPDLRRELPYRTGYDYYIVDDKVLLVQAATNLILDVLTVAAIEALD